jgi:putative transposase
MDKVANVEPGNSVADTPQTLECGDLSPLSPAADLSAAKARQVTPNQSGDKLPHSKTAWPHAPVHKLTEHGVCFVTAGTLHRQRLFADALRLDLLETKLLTLAAKYRWQVEAWAVFANHYHLIARGCPDSVNLGKYLKHLHADTARELNRLDGKMGRPVWFNFWDTKLTFEESYLARLNYVHQNGVKHGLVAVAHQYRWCSVAWFERVATPAMVQTIYRFRSDTVNVEDDF